MKKNLVTKYKEETLTSSAKYKQLVEDLLLSDVSDECFDLVKLDISDADSEDEKVNVATESKSTKKPIALAATLGSEKKKHHSQELHLIKKN